MKWLIASDIHGDSACCEKLLAAFEREKCERLLLLGDLLYHGPRNDLPGGYAPKSVIEQLNSLAEKITCVRGNCDTEVDQQVLEFPIMAEYVWLESGDRMIFATHGHHYGPDRPPLNLGKGDILLCGHTHIPAWRIRLLQPRLGLDPEGRVRARVYGFGKRRFHLEAP